MRKTLFVFLILTFALSWAIWLTMLATGQQVGPGQSASHLPGLAGPTLAALFTTACLEGRGPFLGLLRSLWLWPQRPALVAGLIALPPLLSLAIVGLAGPMPPMADWLAYPGLPAGRGLLPGFLAVLVLNGWGEELGWRCFLFAHGAKAAGPFKAALGVAMLWMIWHLPLFWLNMSMAALWGPVLAGWAFGLICGSFVLAHLWRLSGESALACALWHVSYNYAVATPATEGLAAGVVSVLVMLWGLGIGLCWWMGWPDGSPSRRPAP